MVQHDTLAPETDAPAAAEAPGDRPRDPLAALPALVRADLTPEQRRVVADILAGRSGEARRSGGVDLRITLPLPGRRVFLAVIAGAERRSPARLRRERARHPLLTLANALFVAVLFALGLAAGAAVLLLLGSVLTF